MKSAIGLAALVASTLVLAQGSQPNGIGEVTVAPNPARVGQEVKITISASGEAPSFCGLALLFDDGSDRQIKIEGRENKFPVTIAKTYSKPGSYSIKAEGRKITTHFPCMGTASARLVVDAAPATVAAKPAAAASCPEGYKMNGKLGKAGDFSCKGGKNAKAPEPPPTCGEGLVYFSDEKSKQLGCHKQKAKK